MLIYKTEAEYEAAMDEIYDLMNRGTSLTEAEKDKLREMAVAAEKYEDIHFPFPPPPTPINARPQSGLLFIETAQQSIPRLRRSLLRAQRSRIFLPFEHQEGPTGLCIMHNRIFP